MQYHSILFPYGRPQQRVSQDLLVDLRIDTVLSDLSHGPDQLKYDTCYLPLADQESVLYRHSVFQDIMRNDLFSNLIKFQEMMDSLNMQKEYMKRMKLPVVKYRYFLNRMIEYKKNVLLLVNALDKAPLQSGGLKQLRDDLSEYVSSEDFLKLSAETEELKKELCGIFYQLSVHDNHISVHRLPGDILNEKGRTDFEEELCGFFDQFVGGRADFPRTISKSRDLNPVEEQIINALIRIFPEPFSHLEKFFKKQSCVIPKELVAYHQELGFYTVWLEYILPRQSKGLNFCFPMIVDKEDGFMASNCFDLILADQMLEKNLQVIRNNLVLKPGEHILVLTGPNQGGKTTWARMLGQLFYLGSLGIPVPGTVVRLFLPDRIFTHFERQESQESSNGKLKDDIIRIHDILEQATGKSLILINEMFSSTTLKDAAWLGKKILLKIRQLGAFCLYVTFINELSGYIPGTVSLISQIGEDREERTYQILRGDSDGRAYARSMIKKYSLTYESISERIGSP